MEKKNIDYSIDHQRFVNDIIAPKAIDPQVINAFYEVNRADFVPEDAIDKAYDDRVVHLSSDIRSTISQPSLVALMTRLMDVSPDDTVLEIGTASGYQAAVLSRLARKVHTVEINEELFNMANDRLERLGFNNIETHHGDGLSDLEINEPLDAILITAGIKAIPNNLMNKLNIGGRIVAPVGQNLDELRLIVATKISDDNQYTIKEFSLCSFVPLLSNQPEGWTEDQLDEFEARQIMESCNDFKYLLINKCESAEIDFKSYIERVGRILAMIIGIEPGSIDEGKTLNSISYILATLPPNYYSGDEEKID